MAKKQQTETEVVANTAIATREAGALATVPDFVTEDAGANQGEQLSRDDVQIPRLAIAQQMSPQVNPGKPEYIEDLKIGQMFNSLNGDIFGPGPIRFIPLRVENVRFIEFFPREAGGGVKDMNVPPGDPRTQFTGNEPPVATKFHDYVVLLPDSGAVMALSMKGSNIKVARQFNGLRMTRVMPLGPSKGKPAPLYAQVFEVQAVEKTNKKGTFYVYAIKNAGWTWEISEDVTRQAKSVHDSLRNEVIEIHREREPGEDDEPAAGGDGGM